VDGDGDAAGLKHQSNRAVKEFAMSTKMFVNLPVSDLKKTMAFYKALGFTFNSQFTDETAGCSLRSHSTARRPSMPWSRRP
jgi:hypothetical protein